MKKVKEPHLNFWQKKGRIEALLKKDATTRQGVFKFNKVNKGK